MTLKEFLHMSEGDGGLSYSKNSFFQNGVWLRNQHILGDAIQSLISKGEIMSKGLHVGDLGCGVGSVPLALTSLVIEIMQKKCKKLKRDNDQDNQQVPTMHIYMNDLPSNDFNLLFRDLLNLEVLKRKDDDVPVCFLMGAPGSYYDRLFPQDTLHFVHSSYALHWLSQVPLGLFTEQGVPINKKAVYISEISPESVPKAYLAQFEHDFSRFLKCRSREVVPKGLMLLTLTGRPSSMNSFTWQPFEFEILTRALTCLVHEGVIKEDNLDDFNLPVYCASEKQVDSITKKEGLFLIKHTKTMVLDVAYEVEDKWERAQAIAKYIGAFTKSLISQHFGEHILNLLYDKLTFYTFQHLALGRPAQNCAITILLEKS